MAPLIARDHPEANKNDKASPLESLRPLPMLRPLLLTLTLLWLQGLKAAETPNLVVIFMDDLGYGDIGCFGAKGYQTPRIDSLAAEGRKFTQFHVAQPVCSASRTALLTGCYPNRLGIHGALGPQSRHGIAEREMTLAELVKQKAYATCAVGKWHLGSRPRFLPTLLRAALLQRHVAASPRGPQGQLPSPAPA